MKRSLALLLALVMVLSLLGCQPKDPVETKPGETKETKTSSETEKQTDAPGTDAPQENYITKVFNYEYAFKFKAERGSRDNLYRGDPTIGAGYNSLGYRFLFIGDGDKDLRMEDLFDHYFDNGIASQMNQTLWFNAGKYEITGQKTGTSEYGVDYVVVSGNVTGLDEGEGTRDFCALIFLNEEDPKAYQILFGLAVKPFEEEPAYANNRKGYDDCFSKEELYDTMLYAGQHLKFNDKLFD